MSLQSHHHNLIRRIYQLEIRQGVAIHERELLKRLMENPDDVPVMEDSAATSRGRVAREAAGESVQIPYSCGIESMDPERAQERLELLEAQIGEIKTTIARLRRNLIGLTRRERLGELDRIREQLEDQLLAGSGRRQHVDIQTFVTGNRRLIWKARVIAMACGTLFPEWSEDFTDLPALRRRELFRKIGRI